MAVAADGLIGLALFLAVVVIAGAVRDTSRSVGVIVAVAGYAGVLFLAPLLMRRRGRHNGQTIGKQMLGIRVCRDSGQEIDFLFALVRESFGKFVSGFILGLGYVMAVFDSNHQALHDKLVNTYVVQAA